MTRRVTEPLEITEAEGFFLHGLTEDFWYQLGRLVTRQLQKCPASLRAELLARMQEKTSLYSRYEGK